MRKFRIDQTDILEKSREAAVSVLPIVAVVLILCLSVSPVRTDLLLAFLLGTFLLIFGMGLFSLGAETSMTPIGSKVGTSLTKSRNLPLILLVSFALGFAVTVAEPDLQVLAASVPHIDSAVLLITVGVGVGLFLSLCMLRVLTGVRLRWFLLAAYALVFVLASFSDPDFLSIAFDSGGVTTGPMTVPFILALGVGVSNIRSDRNAEADSFGLVGLCSVGPILAVLILGFFYRTEGTAAAGATALYTDTLQIGQAYVQAIPVYMKETAIALLPVVGIFLLFQLFRLRLSRHNLGKILIGLLYTYVGLVLFQTGVNVGFSSLGAVLGASLAAERTRVLLIPLAMLLGWCIISAEPAVVVLKQQIKEVSAGAIPERAIGISLSVAIALAMGLSALRVLTGLPILWILVPGYIVALLLTFFVPDIYTAIAFDAGGVASGPMTAAFMLQFVIGAGTAVGADILRDAFGLVALVALLPLLSIQLVGFFYERLHRAAGPTAVSYGDLDIVELWEEAAG